MTPESESEKLSLRNDLKLLAVTADPSARAFRTFSGDIAGQPFHLTVYATQRFLSEVRKAKLLNDPVLTSALMNLRYGYDPARAASPGGKDGIFNINATYRPKNEMVVKLYDRYIGRKESVKELGRYLQDPARAQGVRVVCHGLRLLGFVEVHRRSNELWETLVLVDLAVNRRK